MLCNVLWKNKALVNWLVIKVAQSYHKTLKKESHETLNHYKHNFLEKLFLYFILFQEHSMLMISFSLCDFTVLTDVVLLRACNIRGGTMQFQGVFGEPWKNQKYFKGTNYRWSYFHCLKMRAWSIFILHVLSLLFLFKPVPCEFTYLYNTLCVWHVFICFIIIIIIIIVVGFFCFLFSSL